MYILLGIILNIPINAMIDIITFDFRRKFRKNYPNIYETKFLGIKCCTLIKYGKILIVTALIMLAFYVIIFF